MTRKGHERNDIGAGLAAPVAAARALAPLPADEERALVARAKGGDARARDALVRRFLPLVVSFARKQARGTLPLEELVQEGNVGLLHAIEKYDPKAGTRFSTYAVWWVRAYVWKYLKTARSSVRPKSGSAALADVSLDRPVGDEEGDTSDLERLEDPAPAPDARYARTEGDAQVQGALQRARARIGELGWDIVHSRLERDVPETLEEIGTRWGLSRERVRQVEVKTKRLLREVLRPVDDDGRRAA